jgi:putative addiction module killer protein
MIEVVYYSRADGDCPFADWFHDLDSQAAAKVANAIDRMQQGNWSEVKSVGDGVLERRIHFGPGYRVYFGRDGNELVLLLPGGTKSRQQTDIERLKRLWAEYKRRK